MLPHALTSISIQRQYQNKTKFKGVYSWINLLKIIRDGAYVANLVEHKSIGTYWVAFCVDDNTTTFIDSYGVEHILGKMKTFSVNENVMANVYREQVYVSITCGYFCIGFIDFMFKDKSLTDFMNLILPHNFKKNDEGILNYFLK